MATSSSGNINNFIRYLAGMVMRDWGAQLQGPNMAISFNLSKLLSPRKTCSTVPSILFDIFCVQKSFKVIILSR